MIRRNARWVARAAIIGIAAGLAVAGVLDVVGLYTLGALIGVLAAGRGLYRAIFQLATTEALGENGRLYVDSLGAVRLQAVSLVISIAFLVAGLAAILASSDPGPTIARVANDALQIGIIGGVWLIALQSDLEDALKADLVRRSARQIDPDTKLPVERREPSSQS